MTSLFHTLLIFVLTPFSEPSLLFVAWVYAIKLFTFKKPLLYSYQSSLPRLPLPSVDATIERYLRSIKPLCDNDEEYERKQKLAIEFKKGISNRLQRYLVLKSWWASNYVSIQTYVIYLNTHTHIVQYSCIFFFFRYQIGGKSMSIYVGGLLL